MLNGETAHVLYPDFVIWNKITIELKAVPHRSGTMKNVGILRRKVGGRQENKKRQKESESMDEKTKEMIAIGASVGAHCQPCLEYHVAKGRDVGLTDDEIREAIGVGHMVEKGSMAAMKQFSTGILDAPAKPASSGGCCCPGSAPAKKSGCCC